MQKHSAQSPAIRRVGQLDYHKLIAYRLSKNTTLRAKALRAFAGFLALMLVFTLLSRAADEMTIAKVRTEEAQKRSIDHKVSGLGKVRENGAKPVTALPGIRVAYVPLEVGSKVKKGDLLFRLDPEDIQEKLELEKEELKKLELDLSDQESRKGVENSNRDSAIERAEEDYGDAEKDAQRQIDQAQENLTTAENRLEEYRQNRPSYDLEQLQQDYDEARKAVEEAETALEELETAIGQEVAEARSAAGESPEEQDAAEQAVRDARKPELDAATLKAENSKMLSQQAEEALNKAAAAGDSTQEQALSDAVEAARQALNQAQTAKKDALKAAGRSLEDAKKPLAADSSQEKSEMLCDKQQEKIDRYQALLDAGGEVTAPLDGTVTKLEVAVGAPTPEGTALLLADGSEGSTVVAQMPKSQEKYLSPGTPVTLKPGGEKKDVTGLVIDSVQENEEDPELLDVAVSLPDNPLAIGASCELEAVQQSKEYSECVPLSALHEENGSYYLLTLQEKKGVLGTEMTVARLNVEIEEKNDSYAALIPGSLTSGQKYIKESSKNLDVGDRIRLEED